MGDCSEGQQSYPQHNLYMEDVQTGSIEFAHSVDNRGNADESWRHGLNYMIRNYVLEQP
jgi:Protein of unknown function (DUF2380)